MPNTIVDPKTGFVKFVLTEEEKAFRDIKESNTKLEDRVSLLEKEVEELKNIIKSII